jgi:hypothetical protein
MEKRALSHTGSFAVIWECNLASSVKIENRPFDLLNSTPGNLTQRNKTPGFKDQDVYWSPGFFFFFLRERERERERERGESVTERREKGND